VVPVGGASVGGKAISAAISHYVVIQLASVLAPGLVIVTETALLVGRLTATTQNSDLAELTKALSSVRGSVLLVAVVVIVATSYVVGYVCRELGFWMEGWLEARRAKRKRKQAGSATSTAGETLHDLPHLTRARALSGGDVVDHCIEHHPILRMLDNDDGLAVVAGRASRRHWSEHVPDREDAAFHYSKMWLRRYVPVLSVDQTEAEINILVAMVVPVILLGAVAIAWSPYPLSATIIAVPVVVTIVTVLARQAARLRRAERWNAIRNLIFDHMMRTAISRYPAEPPGEPAPADANKAAALTEPAEPAVVETGEAS
jgi:hypothetical protein